MAEEIFEIDLTPEQKAAAVVVSMGVDQASEIYKFLTEEEIENLTVEVAKLGHLTSEQTIAVLQYMLEHNIHHAKELSDMAGGLSGEARHQLLHAVESFDQANGYLSAALEELKK